MLELKLPYMLWLPIILPKGANLVQAFVINTCADILAYACGPIELSKASECSITPPKVVEEISEP